MRWAVGLILFLGLLVRLPGLSAPPLEFHATRQYLGAILARAYYVEHATGLPPAEVAAARAARSLVPAFEPPILQRLTAGIYRVIGREDLRVPRLLSIVAWLAGALALAWLLTQWELSHAGVLAGVSVMVFLPFGGKKAEHAARGERTNAGVCAECGDLALVRKGSGFVCEACGAADAGENAGLRRE